MQQTMQIDFISLLIFIYINTMCLFMHIICIIKHFVKQIFSAVFLHFYPFFSCSAQQKEYHKYTRFSMYCQCKKRENYMRHVQSNIYSEWMKI